jgi:broad specificity phosphatase PhoE
VIRLLERCKTGNLVVIAHGTVITLLVWKFNEIEPIVLWQQLKNPSFVVLALPEFELQEIVESIISSR